MGDYIGLHSAHRHDTIPAGTIRFETSMGVDGFTWTRPTVVEKPDTAKIHATLFKFSQNGLAPFEFGEGPSPVDGTNIPAGLLTEFGNYLAKHDLANTIALQVGHFIKSDGNSHASTAELEVQWGQDIHFTITMPTSLLAPDTGKLIGTGWNVPAASAPAPGSDAPSLFRN